MNHLQVKIQADEAGQEQVIARLSELASGFEQQEDCILAYFEEGAISAEQLAELLPEFSHSTELLGERNWNAEWEKNFTPVIVEDFVAIRAHFHEPVEGVQHELVITPKMSFGTGHHATTWQMMQQMRAIDFSGKRVFDFGTGTGVLAILAEKLGATEVLAIDNDAWSLENAQENCERNGCTATTIALAAELPPAQTFDVILANINRNVLLHFAGQLAALLHPGGRLLLSGLLTSDQDVIDQAYTKAGFLPLTSSEKGNWICLGYVKKF